MENPTLSTLAKANVNKRILIVAPNWIGDAVLSLPVVDGCGQLWQEAELTVLARTRVAELFEAKELCELCQLKGRAQRADRVLSARTGPPGHG